MSLSFTRPARPEPSAGADRSNSADVQPGGVACRGGCAAARDLGEGWLLERLGAAEKRRGGWLSLAPGMVVNAVAFGACAGSWFALARGVC
jgi:hypothetical protein